MGPEQGGGEPRPRLDRRRAVLGGLVVVVVAFAAGWTIYRRRHDFVTAVQSLGYGWMAGSLLAALIAVYGTFESWRAVLAGLDVEIGRVPAARVFFVSQLGKYVPGSVWPIALQMRAGAGHGARARTMLAANLMTLALSCTVGLLVGGITLPLGQPDLLRRYWWVALFLLALLPMLHPRSVPWILDRLFAVLHRPALGERLSGAAAVRAGAWVALSWLAFGAHIALLCAAFGGLSAGDVASCVAAMSLAVTLGVLFIPAPAGAGIRDTVLGIVLASVLGGPGQVLAVVVASRVVLLVVDVLLAASASVRAGIDVGR